MWICSKNSYWEWLTTYFLIFKAQTDCGGLAKWTSKQTQGTGGLITAKDCHHAADDSQFGKTRWERTTESLWAGEPIVRASGYHHNLWGQCWLFGVKGLYQITTNPNCKIEALLLGSHRKILRVLILTFSIDKLGI